MRLIGLEADPSGGASAFLSQTYNAQGFGAGTVPARVRRVPLFGSQRPALTGEAISGPRAVSLADGSAYVFEESSGSRVFRVLPGEGLDLSFAGDGRAEAAVLPIAFSDGRLLEAERFRNLAGGFGDSYDLQRLLPEAAPPVTLEIRDGYRDVVIRGTVIDDRVEVALRQSDGRYVVRTRSFVRSLPPGSLGTINFLGFAGDDELVVEDDVAKNIWADLGGGEDFARVGLAVPASYVAGNAGNDTILGGSGRDTLAGSSGNDIIAGNGGDDLIFGNNGADALAGGGGRDLLYGGGGGDFLHGGRGTDRASASDVDLFADIEGLI